LANDASVVVSSGETDAPRQVAESLRKQLANDTGASERGRDGGREREMERERERERGRGKVSKVKQRCLGRWRNP